MSDLKGAAPEPKTNRRELLHSVGLKSAIGVAGVAAGTVLGNAGTTGAITGEPLTLGRVGNTAGGSTTTIYTGASTSVHAFTFADNSGVVPTDQGTATVVGHSTMLSAGVLGSSVSRGGTGVVASSSGVSGVGLRAAAGGPGGIAISANGGSVGVEAHMTPSEDNSGVIVTGARRGISTSATTAFPLSLAPGTQTSGAPAIAARVGDVAVPRAHVPRGRLVRVHRKQHERLGEDVHVQRAIGERVHAQVELAPAAQQQRPPSPAFASVSEDLPPPLFSSDDFPSLSPPPLKSPGGGWGKKGRGKGDGR